MGLTRFVFTTKTKINGDTVTLRHRLPWLADGDANKITDMVARARQMLLYTIAALNSGKANLEFARTYFKGDPTADEWKRITAKLELIYGGLNTDVTLKLGADGHDGYVRATIFWHGPDEYTESFKGSTIHVNKKRMLGNEERGLKILLHEASHKYANTEDNGRAGYRLANDSDWAADGLTKADALNNADSYAHFVYWQGASMGA